MIHHLEADSIQLQIDNRNILSNIYLSSETGKITGLLGRNGQGKSCLLNILYGTMPCESSVRIDRVSIKDAYQKPDLLRYLPQFNFIPKSLTLKRVFQDFALDFSIFTEKFPGFTENLSTRVGTLSGGEQRLVALYILVKSNSLFVLLDEPFTHLSPIQIEMVKHLLLEEKENKGILLTDHLHRQVMDICDNLYVLANGKTHLIKSETDIEALGYAKMHP
ncbi:MAG: ATP-binding cassette domain-containing protein [Bacteroidota bacterium]|nr:ATP-binding cassette domain-containing protein [Bacteroidota bacterium]